MASFVGSDDRFIAQHIGVNNSSDSIDESNDGTSNRDKDSKLSSLLSDNQRVCENSFLTEDIPGASIKKPYEKYSMHELGWWLLCRGVTVPTTLRKAEIIQR